MSLGFPGQNLPIAQGGGNPMHADWFRWFREVYRRVSGSPIDIGELLDDVDLDAYVANDVEHGLGRAMTGCVPVVRPGLNCSFYLDLSSDLSAAIPDNTFTTVAWNRTQYDTGSNTASGIFTAPRTGAYHLSGCGQFSVIADGDRGEGRIVTTSHTFGGARYRTGALVQVSSPVPGIRARMDKGDTAEFQLRHDSGSNEDVLAGNGSYFMGHAIDELSWEPRGDDYVRLYSSCDRTVSLWVW